MKEAILAEVATFLQHRTKSRHCAKYLEQEAFQSLSSTNISGDRALIPRQSKKCPQKHGGFWPKIRHFYVTNLWYRPLTSYECGKRG